MPKKASTGSDNFKENEKPATENELKEINDEESTKNSDANEKIDAQNEPNKKIGKRKSFQETKNEKKAKVEGPKSMPPLVSPDKSENSDGNIEKDSSDLDDTLTESHEENLETDKDTDPTAENVPNMKLGKRKSVPETKIAKKVKVEGSNSRQRALSPVISENSNDDDKDSPDLDDTLTNSREENIESPRKIPIESNGSSTSVLYEDLAVSSSEESSSTENEGSEKSQRQSAMMGDELNKRTEDSLSKDDLHSGEETEPNSPTETDNDADDETNSKGSPERESETTTTSDESEKGKSKTKKSTDSSGDSGLTESDPEETNEARPDDDAKDEANESHETNERGSEETERDLETTSSSIENAVCNGRTKNSIYTSSESEAEEKNESRPGGNVKDEDNETHETNEDEAGQADEKNKTNEGS